MDPDETPFVLPQDVPPLLQDAEESLYRVIGNAPRVRRNMQKILHLIARCIKIIEDLGCSISPPPSTFEEMITNIESVRKLEILLVKFDGAVTTEASLPASLNHEMMETWESSRDEFYELLKEPSNGWEKDVEQVSRLDDYLWVSWIAQDMRGKGIDGAQKAESIAASILEGDQDPSNLNREIETVMSDWKTIADLSSLSISKDRGSQYPSLQTSISSSSPAIMRPQIPNELSSDQAIQVSSPDLRRGSARGSDSGDTSQPPTGSRFRDKPQKLAKWRIDSSSIEFPKGGPEFRGEFATVSPAFLVFSSASKGSADNPAQTGGENESHDRIKRKKAIAVKKMTIENGKDKERVLRLALREAGFLTELSHQNVIEFEGFVEELSEDRVWLVFPWEANGTLRDFVASADWDIPERIWLINGVARGMEYLHTQDPPICHGDLKSPNVLVNSKYRAIITDFGSARRLTRKHPPVRSERSTKGTQPAPLLETEFREASNTMTLKSNRSTLRWAAPELLAVDEPGLWSDIWAFGWIFYEAMTNSIPFQDVEKDFGSLIQVIRVNFPSVTSRASITLVRSIYSLINTCWNIDPSKRPTAEDCRNLINRMPMASPDRQNPSVSRTRSADLLVKTAETNRSENDYITASELLTEALGIYTETADDEGKAKALFGLARVNWDQKNTSEAVKLYSEVVQIYTDIGNSQGRANALLGLGEVHRLQKNYSEAVTFYSEVVQICNEAGNREQGASAMWGLAEVHRAQQKYSEAVPLYSEVIQICTDNGERRGRINGLWGLAKVHRAQKEYSEAVPLYSEIIQICTDIGDRRGRANALWGLAEAHQLQKQYSQAVQLFSESLQICIDLGDTGGRAMALMSLANVYRDQDQHKDAMRLYEQAAEVFEGIGVTRSAATALNRAAEARRKVESADAE